MLILFATLATASIISIYYTHQHPTQEETTTNLAYYQHTGTYDYTAKLKPNTLYSQPTLKPGEGTLYTKIIDHINITFTYTFTCSHPTNITSIKYQTKTELESPENWIKDFTTAEMVETFQIANTVNSAKQTASTTLLLNVTQIDELVKAVDGQIGTSTSQYNLAIIPEIHVAAEITVAEADVHTIYETFNSSLTIEFRKETPNYISMESLEHTRPGVITETHRVLLQWVINQRLTSYVATTVTIPLLAVTAWFYIKTKPTKPAKEPIEKIIAPYKEIIAETTQKPPETTRTIIMVSLEDLAKIAESMVKPILHKKGPKTTHTFYILDNNIKYEYVIEET